MLLKHGLSGLALVTASSGSAMASDTSALYWYAPDSVVESGGTISAWNDKTSNGNNLAQVASLTMPTYNASGYVEFTGSTIIGDASFPFANTIRGAWNTSGTGEYALFCVALPDWSGQGTSNTGYVQVCDGPATAYTTAKHVELSALNNTFTNIGNAESVHRAEGAGSTYVTQAPSTQTSAARTALLALHLIYARVDQSGRTVAINDGTITNTEAAPADVATSQAGFFIGGRCDGSTTLNSGWIGRIYEVFATGDASTTNVNAIRSELLTKYGI